MAGLSRASEVITVMALLCASAAIAQPAPAIVPTGRFKGAPFVEPLTGLSNFRDRWFDPSTGTFVSPDRMGYRDSPSTYSFAGGDPVNGADPTGLYQADVHAGLTYELALLAGMNLAQAERVALANVDVDLDPSTNPVRNASEGNWFPIFYWHFPINPGEFVVLPGSATATSRVRAAHTYTELGRALHTYQDSFSHSKAYAGNIIDQARSGPAKRTLGLATFAGEITYPELGIMHQTLRQPRNVQDAIEVAKESDYTWLRPDLAWHMVERSFEEMLNFQVRAAGMTEDERAWRKMTLHRDKHLFYRFFNARTRAEKISALLRLSGQRAVHLVPWHDVSLPER